MGQVSVIRANGGQSAVLSSEKHTCNDLLEPCPKLSRPSQPSHYDQEVWRGNCYWKSKPVSYHVRFQALHHHNGPGGTDLIYRE